LGNASNDSGASLMMLAGVYLPLSIAVAYTYGLNALPGWRWAIVARSNPATFDA